MKQISIQSRGDRLVRVIDRGPHVREEYRFNVWGKISHYQHAWWLTVRAILVADSTKKNLALKAAAEWLRDAKE